MSGMGFHWTPCKGGGDGGWVKALAVVLLAAMVAGPVTAAVSAVAHVVVLVVEITAIVAASVLGLGVLALTGWGARRAVRWRAARRVAVSGPAPALTAPSWPDRPALGVQARRALPAPVVPGVVVSESEKIEA